jgi:hypothetical protein
LEEGRAFPKPNQVSALSRNTKSMGDTMTELLALSVSVAVLGGIWAFIALGLWGASLSFGLGSSQQAASLLRVVISKRSARRSLV